jgi:hypothetical protein
MKQPKKKTRKKRDRYDILSDKRDRALDHVIVVWSKGPYEDSAKLDRALDLLTLAHAAVTFEYVSGI